MRRQTALAAVIMFAFSLFFVAACGDKKEHEKKPQATATAKVNLGDGLDLQALLEVVKKEGSAEKIEEALNKDGGINNLDLNGNGKIDYIKVHEYGEGDHRGLSLTMDMADGEVQEIADVKFERSSDGKVVVQARGNEALYGQNAYYNDHWLADAIILSYLFNPHPFYVSPYRYGFYPPYYNTVRQPVPITVYRQTTVKTYTTNSTVQRADKPAVKNTVQSPNAGKSPMSATQTQRNLDKRDPSQPLATGGFGKDKVPAASPSGQAPSAVSKPGMSPTETQRTLEKRDSSQPMATGGFGKSGTSSSGSSSAPKPAPRVSTPSASPPPRAASPPPPRPSTSSGGGSSRGSSSGSRR